MERVNNMPLITFCQNDSPGRLNGDIPLGPGNHMQWGVVRNIVSTVDSESAEGTDIAIRIWDCPVVNLFERSVWKLSSVRCIQALDGCLPLPFRQDQYEELNIPKGIDMSGSLHSSSCGNETVISVRRVKHE